MTLVEESAGISAHPFMRAVLVLFTAISCSLAAAVPGRFRWLHVPTPAVAVFYALIGVAFILGLYRSTRMAFQMDALGVTVRNFFRTRRFGWDEVAGFAGASDSETGAWILSVLRHAGRPVGVTATFGMVITAATTDGRGRKISLGRWRFEGLGFVSAVTAEASRRGKPAEMSRGGRSPFSMWYILWIFAVIALASIVLRSGDF